MNKICNITVYEYPNENEVKEMKVKAVCVGGEEGVFAVFRMPNNDQIIGFASGDDGHRWLTETHHVDWIGRIAEAIKEIKEIDI